MLILLFFVICFWPLIVTISAVLSKAQYIKKINNLPFDFSHSFYRLRKHPQQIEKQLCPSELFGEVYLIHGTFAVSAPLKDWALMIEKRLPSFARFFFHISKVIIDVIYLKSKDMGIFTEQYCEQLKSQFNINSTLFYWSGHNDHLARLNAALSLVKKLAENSQKNKTVTLVCHSHAGQIAALITQLLFEFQIWEDIFKNNKEMLKKFDFDEIKKNCLALKETKFNIVTMGMAPRYQFVNSSQIKLLHFIHSPSGFPYARHWSCIFWGPKGDLIQQWALEGSDTKSFDHEARSINRPLDQHLDQGNNRFSWNRAVKSLKRLPPFGINILIDFDEGYSFLTFIQSIMGHGQYTQVKYINSIWPIIIKHLK